MDTISSEIASSAVDDGRLLPSRLVCERYHIVDRTLDRWIRDEALGFPQPVMINKRRYFRELALRDWERKRANKTEAA